MKKSNGMKTTKLASGLILFLATALLLPSTASAGFNLPTFGAPKEVPPLTVTRQLTYAPTDAENKPITAYQIAVAIADAFPKSSRYGLFQERKADYAYTKLSSNGVTNGPVTSVESSGVQAKTTGDKILVEYITQVRNTSGTGKSTTSVTLGVTPTPNQPGQFVVSTSQVIERLGTNPGTGIMGLDPVASIENIAADIERAITKMQPRLHLFATQTDEFDVPFSAASVFANFERKLGKPAIFPGHPNQTMSDSREGRFTLDMPSVVPSVLVKVFPYHDKAKVSIGYSVPYEMSEGGNSTFPADGVVQLRERLRKIATD